MKFTDPSTLCLFLLAAVVLLLLFRTRVRVARQQQRWAEEAKRPAEDGQSPPAGAGPKGELPGELARWEVQMHETARELAARLDAKLCLLQSLIADADRAARRLEEALERAYPALPPGSQAESLRPAAANPRENPDEAETAMAPAERTAAASELPGNMDRARRREEIHRLADYGFAPEEIARRVGSPVGEVELILSLRGK
jgi:hypothetical protein